MLRGVASHSLLHCRLPRRLLAPALRRSARRGALTVAGVAAGFAAAFAGASIAATGELAIPVLTYHRFAETAVDSMTVRTSTFESHLALLRARNCTVIPLQEVLRYHAGARDELPPRPVAVTADDGHRSVVTEMLPRVLRARIPVTLFIYPSAISNAAYALRWDEVEALQKSGWFTVVSHTYWHPNFREERRRLPAEAYDRLVRTQLERSRSVLEERLGRPVRLLAWPFGLYDDDLMRAAARAGYEAAFSLEPRPVTRADPAYALPRFLMVDSIDANALGRRIAPSCPPPPPTGTRSP